MKKGQEVDMYEKIYRPGPFLPLLMLKYMRELVSPIRSSHGLTELISHIQKYNPELHHLEKDNQLRRFLRSANDSKVSKISVDRLLSGLRTCVPFIFCDEARTREMLDELFLCDNLTSKYYPHTALNGILAASKDWGDDLSLARNLLIHLNRTLLIVLESRDAENSDQLTYVNCMHDLGYLLEMIHRLSHAFGYTHITAGCWSPTLSAKGELIPTRYLAITDILSNYALKLNPSNINKNGKPKIIDTLQIHLDQGAREVTQIPDAKKAVQRMRGKKLMKTPANKVQLVDPMPYDQFETITGSTYFIDRAILATIQLIHIVQSAMIAEGVPPQQVVDMFNIGHRPAIEKYIKANCSSTLD